MKKHTLLWATFLLASVVFAIFLTGCGGDARGSNQGDQSSPGGVAAVLHRVALVATGVAGSAIILSFAASWFFSLSAGILWRIISYALVTIAAAQAVYWIASHVWVLVATLAAVAVGWLYLHRRILERFVGKDLDGDGKLGDAATKRVPAIR